MTSKRPSRVYTSAYGGAAVLVAVTIIQLFVGIWEAIAYPTLDFNYFISMSYPQNYTLFILVVLAPTLVSSILFIAAALSRYNFDLRPFGAILMATTTSIFFFLGWEWLVIVAALEMAGFSVAIMFTVPVTKNAR